MVFLMNFYRFVWKLFWIFSSVGRGCLFGWLVRDFGWVSSVFGPCLF